MAIRGDISHRIGVRLWGHTDFAIMWAVALLGAASLRNTEDADFERFLGGVPPVVAVGAAGLVGIAALRSLDRAGWVGSDPGGRGMLRATGFALGFGVAILIADSVSGFGEAINIAWPTSVVFYPVMAFVAEVAFHLVPLALVVAASRGGQGARAGANPVVAVALIEAAYQFLGSSTADTSPWLMGYLFFHMIAFGFVGLTSLRRSGFASMMWMRLFYYLIWHVIWGVLRLDWLF